jgi:hypothetical protein
MLTQERLKSLLHYDPETGVFTRLVPVSPNTNAGDVAGYINGKGYVNLRVDGMQYQAHRLACLYMTGTMPDLDIDHIDLVKTNNTWRNLRPATQALNNANKAIQSNNRVGYKGVSLHNGGPKYRSDVKVNGKKKYLGCFYTAEEAHAAYVKAANDMYGEYARAA